MGPEEARSAVLTVVEGAIIGAFRRHTGRAERMNRTIEDATVKRSHSDSRDQRRTHLHRFGGAYDPARRRTTLHGPTPTEFILDACTKEPIASGSIRHSASRDHAPRTPGRGGDRVPGRDGRSGLTGDTARTVLRRIVGTRGFAHQREMIALMGRLFVPRRHSETKTGRPCQPEASPAGAPTPWWA